MHADEYLGPGSHEFDKVEFDQLLQDPDVKQWLAAMTEKAFLPVKRTNG